jgi:uncharacterized protein YciI
MAFLIICRASTDICELRRRNRRPHLKYILRHRHQILFGGALLSEDETQMTGMVIALDVPDRALAAAFVHDEPYCAAGMFPHVTIERWGHRIPEPRAGFLEGELAQEQSVESADEPTS